MLRLMLRCAACLLALLTPLALCACGGHQQEPAPTASPAADSTPSPTPEADDKDDIILDVAGVPIVEVEESGFQGLTISLPEYPDSGYEWVLRSVSGSGSMSSYEEHIPPEGDSPGMHNYHLAGEEQGKLVLQFYYVEDGDEGDIDNANGSANYIIGIAEDGALTLIDEVLWPPEF